ncbi:RDD family protein [Desertibacillus haloalkaliphilus]|uniref:RDD family protein n=1 Tax=Desertibacillus haloalkaliphilus TaxID=1328930 RepID=UPI001C26F5ED|nr:RDD family protein [Desertibacillus haloalkaliphilus]MBU8905192.1 RDD family protein [Desertibacillus haloalkaliphilus]
MDHTMNDEQLETKIIEEAEKQEGYQFAGFWMRLWAFLFDAVVVFSLNSILVTPLIRWQELTTTTVLRFFTLEAILTAIVGFAYFVLLTKLRGQTLGKTVFGMRVVAKNETLTWSAVIFREVIGRFIHQVFFFMSLLYLTVAFSTKKQGIHDMIADTYVIHER